MEFFLHSSQAALEPYISLKKISKNVALRGKSESSVNCTFFRILALLYEPTELQINLGMMEYYMQHCNTR